MRFDPEKVAPFLRRRYRRDLLDGKFHTLACEAGKRELALLTNRYRGNVALVDLENDPVSIERGDLKQHFALLNRGPEKLGEIARDHDAVKRSRESRTRELVAHQR